MRLHMNILKLVFWMVHWGFMPFTLQDAFLQTAEEITRMIKQHGRALASGIKLGKGNNIGVGKKSAQKSSGCC